MKRKIVCNGSCEDVVVGNEELAAATEQVEIEGSNFLYVDLSISSKVLVDK